MNTPIFLGINNGPIVGWLILLVIAILFILGLIAIAGMMVYFSGYYINRLIRRIRNK
jgi:hypothetical protein